MSSRESGGLAAPAGYVMVQTAVDGEDAAARLADGIVASRLAACVQTGRVRSTYRWRGKVERADECILTAKTRGELAERLIAHIRAAHPYEVPEIVVTPIVGGFGPYLEWLEAETETAPGPGA